MTVWPKSWTKDRLQYDQSSSSDRKLEFAGNGSGYPLITERISNIYPVPPPSKQQRHTDYHHNRSITQFLYILMQLS